MIRNLSLICYVVIGIFVLPLSAQEQVALDRSYASISFPEFARQIEQAENLEFFFVDEALDSIRIEKLDQGISLESALERIFRESEFNFLVDKQEVFIFRGLPVVKSLPRYESFAEEVEEAAIASSDTASGESQYLETKSVPEEQYITVGSGERADPRTICNVRGRIINKDTGEPLIGATVFVKETEKGTITDVNGSFNLRLTPGTYQISVDHMAMKSMEYGLDVRSDGEMSIELQNELIQLEEVTLVNKRQSNVEGMLMGFDRISTESMKQIPVVMGEKDVIKIAQLLPGVQNAGEGSSGFNVRGGSADQNMFYINDISVYNTSHLFGFFTAFSPDIISDFALYKTNVPAKYGGRIASIFEVTTRQGNKEEFFAQGGISPVTGHVMAEGPIVKDKASFVASWRSTYSDWLLKRMNDDDLRQSDASFYDGTLGLNAEINEKNQIEAFFYRSSDRFSLSYRNNYDYANTGGSLKWKHTFSDYLSADFTLANSHYQFSTIDQNNPTESYEHEYFINHAEARADFLSIKSENHRIEFGASSILYDLNRGEILPFGDESKRIPVDLGKERGVENALYISDEFKVLPDLSLLLGMRYSHYSQIGPEQVRNYEAGEPRNDNSFTDITSYGPGELVKSYGGFEPRAAVNYKVGLNTSIKASYNRLRQYIFLLSNTIALAPNDQWKLTDSHIRPPVSDQLSVGFYHDVRDPSLNISVELYKKWVNNVVEYKDGADFISGEPLEMKILQGNQETEGIELMVRKNSGNLTGWVSYTLSRSMVEVNGPFDEQTINDGIPYPSNFDRPHSFNLVSNLQVSRRVSFSSNIVYSTGRPVTLPVSAYYNEGRPYLLYSSRNAYRIPDYFRIDLSVNLEGNLKFKKIAHSYWMLNVYNLTGRHNAYSVFYEVENGEIQGKQLSIFARPIVTLSWNFKFGNYNSK